jgi:hypothetical protein
MVLIDQKYIVNNDIIKWWRKCYFRNSVQYIVRILDVLLNVNNHIFVVAK